MSFPSDLATGDSEAIQKDLVKRVTKLLVDDHHWKLVNRLKDAVGVYALILRDAHGSRIYVIMKGSRLWKGTVSCQGGLPLRALGENTPILMVWIQRSKWVNSYVYGQVKFYLFDPHAITHEKTGYNIRKKVRMINFPIKLGVPVDPDTDLGAAFKKLKKIRTAKLSSFFSTGDDQN